MSEDINRPADANDLLKKMRAITADLCRTEAQSGETRTCRRETSGDRDRQPLDDSGRDDRLDGCAGA